jgi:hypothetical protein
MQKELFEQALKICERNRADEVKHLPHLDRMVAEAFNEKERAKWRRLADEQRATVADLDHKIKTLRAGIAALA